MSKLTAAFLAAVFVLAILASPGLAAHRYHTDRSGSTIVAQ
jgi:hypothetical protein